MDLAKSSSGAGFLPTEDADSAKKELLVARNVLEIGAKVRYTFVYRVTIPNGKNTPVDLVMTAAAAGEPLLWLLIAQAQ